MRPSSAPAATARASCCGCWCSIRPWPWYRSRAGRTPASWSTRSIRTCAASTTWWSPNSSTVPQFLGAEHAVLFSALPHGVSGATLDGLLEELPATRVKAIDLSGDLRLKDAAAHKKAYPESPSLPERRRQFVYGLPELNRERIRAVSRIANPGCLATAAILAAAPLIDSQFCGPLVIDAKTGSSGAGREPKETTHHPTRHADFRAYKPLAHQHEPEILQALGDPLGQRIELSFVPQSMAVSRGIFATVHATLPEPTDADALLRQYEQFYAGSPFVRLTVGSPALAGRGGLEFLRHRPGRAAAGRSSSCRRSTIW